MKRQVILGLAALFAALPVASRQATPGPSRPDWVGCPDEMTRLDGLIGTWHIQPEMYRPKRREWTPGIPFLASFHRRFDRCYVESDQIVPLGEGAAFRNGLLFSYDKFRKLYRMVALENVVGLIDVFEGDFSGDTLVMDDERSGTAAPSLSGKLEFARIRLRIGGADEAQIDFLVKRDGAWVDGARYRMRRQHLTPP